MKTRIITAIVGILVLIGVMFTFNTMVFNLVIAAITLIAIHEIYSALGFEKKTGSCTQCWYPIHCWSCFPAIAPCASWSCRCPLCWSPFCHLSGGAQRHHQLPEGQRSFGVSGIVIFCFYSFVLLKERLPVEKFGYDAVFFILLILCFAWGGDDLCLFCRPRLRQA